MAYYPTIEREIVGRGIKNTIIHIYEVSGDIDCGGNKICPHDSTTRAQVIGDCAALQDTSAS